MDLSPPLLPQLHLYNRIYIIKHLQCQNLGNESFFGDGDFMKSYCQVWAAKTAIVFAFEGFFVGAFQFFDRDFGFWYNYGDIRK